MYFSGVDMLDGTPVLDIKPYIPQYDNPVFLHNQNQSCTHRLSVLPGNNIESIDHSSIPREAPDGEEDSTDGTLNAVANALPNDQVRIYYLNAMLYLLL